MGRNYILERTIADPTGASSRKGSPQAGQRKAPPVRAGGHGCLRGTRPMVRKRLWQTCRHRRWRLDPLLLGSVSPRVGGRRIGPVRRPRGATRPTKELSLNRLLKYRQRTSARRLAESL